MRKMPFARHFGAYALALLGLASLTFALPLLLPGDPVAAFLGPDARIELDATARAVLLAEHGLTGSSWSRYLAYCKRLVRFDLGWSFQHGMPVADLLAAHLPWTLLLAGCALALSLTAGFVLGLEAAFLRGSRADRLLTAVMLALDSLPLFAVAMALVYVCTFGLGWFPASGAMAPFSTATGAAAWLERARHLALPACALALPVTAGVFLVSRSGAVDMLPRAFMTLARAKGVGAAGLRYRHLAPNVFGVVIARMGAMSARLLAGGVFVEKVFAYPGVNLLLLDAVAKHDYPVVRGVVLVLGLMLFGLNFLADGIVAYLLRRSRRSA
jgi:peptide/nickel transport system permease protein